MPQPYVLAAVLIVLLALLLVAIRLWRRKSAPLNTTLTSHPGQDTGSLDYYRRAGVYWGVAIRPRGDAPGCAAVEAMRGQSFPLKQAPTLPLPGCDAGSCHCSYQPLLDHRDARVRRTNTDRRTILRYEPDKQDRRQLTTRRRKSGPGNKPSGT